MVTDHLLIRRAARELDRSLAGGRIRDAGLADDGSVALVVAIRGQTRTLHVLPFASPPLVWLSGEAGLALGGEPAWLRAAGAVLRGLRITAVRARRGDRILRLDLEARSRFGVPDRFALVLELVPRFGNVVLLKGDTVVAAAKTFSPADNPERSVEIGGRYEPPPAPAWKIPRLLAAAWPEERLAELEAAADADAPVHVSRRGGVPVAVHVVPLPDDGLPHTAEPRLLDVFAEAASREGPAERTSAVDRRRDRLLARLVRRRDAIDAQLAHLLVREQELSERDALRLAGEAIYTHLGAIPAGASELVAGEGPHARIALDPQLTAKENAARYFAQYRKAGASLLHLRERREALERERGQLETTIWEAERADDAAIAEIAADLEGKPQPRSARRIEPIVRESGARIYVGRSPRENAHITFALARPDDLWFHARNVPGAHVLLHSASAQTQPGDIEAAARLAAANSRARGSAAVDVDYAPRKYVRKQRDAAPGMVWYTNFKTIRVAPDQPEARSRK